MRLVTASLIGLLVGTPLLAQEPVRDERQHVVTRGETLWDLAGVYYENPFRWPVIYRANPMVIEDPHWIYPEEVLVIPGIYDEAGQPPVPVADAVPPQPVDRPLRTVFYREDAVLPGQQRRPTVLSEPALEDVPVRESEFRVAEFLAYPEELPRYGRMLRPKRETLSLAGVVPTAHPKDVIYLDYAGGSVPAPGEMLTLVEVGRQVPEADYQHIMTPTAIVEILDLGEDVISARIVTQFAEVRRDQLLVPMERFPNIVVTEAEPVPGGSDLRGRILEFVFVQPLYSRTDRGFIDLGRQDGVQVGDVFLAYLPQREAEQRGMFGTYGTGDILPPEGVAELRVVKVMDRTATVFVDGLLLPRLQDGMWVQRIRRIP